MPAKRHVSKRKSLAKAARKQLRHESYSSFFIIFSLIVLVLAAFLLYHTAQKQHVLGASVYLARGGDDSGGSDSISTDTSGGSNSGGSNITSGGSSGDSQPSETSSTTTTSGSVSNDTQVDCVGPDGKHFTTSFHDCSDLNRSWHRNNFSFTTLRRDHNNTSAQNPTIQLTPTQQDGRVRTEDNPRRHDTEFEKINDELKASGTEVEKDASDSGLFHIRQASSEARTKFPLSIDPKTNALIITTPAGVKTVAILPQKAIDNLLGEHIFNSIESKESSGSAIQQTDLTLLGNQPVFAVNGVANKKVLGVIPVSFAKTAFVSAETGDVVKVNEAIFSKLLELLSF